MDGMDDDARERAQRGNLGDGEGGGGQSAMEMADDDAAAARGGATGALFAEGEKVLCFHGPLIYEAKVNQVQVAAEGEVRYRIHYNGWNKKWDEWVSATRMLKHNEGNLQHRRELGLAHDANVRVKKAAGTVGIKRKLGAAAEQNVVGAAAAAVEAAASSPLLPPLPPPTLATASSSVAKQYPSASTTCATAASVSVAPTDAAPESHKMKPSRSSSRKNATPTSTTAKKNAKRIQVSAKEERRKQDLGPISDRPSDNTVETEDQFYTKVEVRINIPDELKPYLVDDWDYLTRQQKLVVLPARITVDQIIQDYIKAKKNGGKGKESKTNREGAVAEVTNGLLEYFNVMLNSQLLYKIERGQHAELMRGHPGKAVSKLYGSIHLLRLFVKLGGMLTYTQLDEKSIQLLLHYIHDILLYMKKNANTLFTLQDYETAPSSCT